MSATVKVKMNDTQKILIKRSLNENGKAQVFFTKECAKEFNNYVPFLTGRLKDMNVELTESKIIYNAPYAKKQYYTNKGAGIKNNSGLRGKLWDRRAWADKGSKIIKSVSEFVGGRAK